MPFLTPFSLSPLRAALRAAIAAAAPYGAPHARIA
jgi:hypothetical protein